METQSGKNGVLVGDNGDCWRAFGSKTVQSPQTYDYTSHSGPTGIKYGMGFDPVAGGTRIAFVDYPKRLYTAEEVMDGEDTLTLLTRCNVCSAMDQAAKRTGKAPYEAPASQAPIPQPQQAYSQPSPVPERLSIGAAAATLPKWLPTMVKLVKPFALRPVGDATFTLGMSMLADFMSGIAPPEYRQALQAFSDDMIDTIDPNLAEKIKEDAISIADAALKDGDSVMSSKFLRSALFKTRGDLRNEVDQYKKNSGNRVPGNSSSSSFVSMHDQRSSGELRPLRLWDG